MLTHETWVNGTQYQRLFSGAAATPTLRAMPAAPVAARISDRGGWYSNINVLSYAKRLSSYETA